MFDKEMPYPREAVTQCQSKRNEPKIAHDESQDQTYDAQCAADEMQYAAAGGRMFSHVIRPEFLEGFDTIFLVHHRYIRMFAGRADATGPPGGNESIQDRWDR